MASEASVGRDISDGGRATFAFISPSGWGNLGDAAIIESLLHGIRRRVPGARLVGFTLNPADTRKRHGVEAHPISSMAMPFYPIAGSEPVSPEPEGTPPPSGEPSPRRRIGGWARTLVRRSSPATTIAGLMLAAGRIGREPAAMRMLQEGLKGASAVIVAGGGQLDARFGGLFGQPYVLWRWGRIAHSLGARYLFMSVGTGSLGWASRLLCLRALGGAGYRSYRDEGSRDLLRTRWTGGDPIVPDLAYAVPIVPHPPRGGARPVVGVSPMTYRHPDFNVGGSRPAYEEHVKTMGIICRTLLAEGCDVVLFHTDGPDQIAVAEVRAAVEGMESRLAGRLAAADTSTLTSLWSALAGFDAVVAARMHGVLLAHVANRPVLALAHERKVQSLMAEMDHRRFCFDPRALDVHDVLSGLRGLLKNRGSLARALEPRVAALRARVELQYDEVFGGPSQSESAEPRVAPDRGHMDGGEGAA